MAADREAAEAAAAVAAVDAAEVRLRRAGKGDPVKVVAAEAMVAAAVAEEARQRAQAVAAAAAAAQPLVVSGRNFAPTPTLRCELHAPAMDEPTGGTICPTAPPARTIATMPPVGAAARDDASHVISATRVRCAAAAAVGTVLRT